MPTVNNYIYGAVGGPGGEGHGTGGGGGVGQGPNLNYEIKAERFIMNNHGPGAGIRMLHQAVALEALYDSAESFPQPKCHPETRQKLLDNLYDWAMDPDSAYKIRWLHGPAGAGKSAVMQTLCHRLQDADRLGGGFFFKRDHATRGNAKMLFATLAYELALHRSELLGPISRTVEINPSLLGRGMDVQLRNLILEPCKLLQDATPLVILVDGLDECEGHNIQREILRLIASTVDNPLRILLASRPEPHIRETFDGAVFQDLVDSLNIEQSFEDVRTYLRDEFSRIHREHPATMQNIPTPWPSQETVEILVKKSSGYFIYASTVIKFVDDEYSWPSQQLDIIIQNLVPHDTESPFQVLDQLYIQILSAAPVRHRSHLCDILFIVMQLPFDAGNIDHLLGLEPGQVSLILRPLHSVLEVPSDGEIQVHHASFRDFLNSQERSSIFYVGSPQHRKKLACSILKALAYEYEDPQKNCDDRSFRWEILLSPTVFIRYIISIAPSPDFVPLIRLVNPDFVLFNHIDSDVMTEFIRWLKRINPIPQDLIRRWDDYGFINLSEHIQRQITRNLLEKRDQWCPETTDRQVCAPSLRTLLTLQSRMTQEFQSILASCRELLTQSPQLFRILQVTRLFISPRNDRSIRFVDPTGRLVQLRIVLDLSWEDIRASFCSLRPFVNKESAFFCTLFLFLPTIYEELDRLSLRTVAFKDLACGLLRLMRRIENRELPKIFWRWRQVSADWQFREWGRYIRCSPQSDPELLKELMEFVPAWDVFSEWDARLEPVDFHDVIQWLKVSHYPLLAVLISFQASSNPQHDLIDRWQGYLKESMEQAEVVYTNDELEKRWENHVVREAYFYGPPQAFDEEVIRCWEACLSEFTSSGRGGEEEYEASGDEEWYSASSGEDDNNDE
ncbi:hypothetical protein DFH09DRAFT_388515 [Mycena vulgaris]|nr:hypothetical protein DFH09DRAFT_388515 [Mycena vulgaris]